jgi:pyruvate dehydrogenase E1 component beta subunit
VAAWIAEVGFDYLDTPVKRVSAPDTPAPFAPVMERFYVPDENKVIAAVREIL